MRITPNRLKEIIREELINEAVPSYKPKSPSVDIGSGDSAVSNFHTSAVDGMADKAWQDHWIPAKPIVKIARGLGVIDHVDLSDKKQIRETAQVLQHIQKEGFKRIKEGSLDWEKNFKWAKTDELKVIQFLIGMSHGGISDVIKDMKKNPSAFKSFVKDLAKQGLYEGFGGALKKEDRKKFDDMRRRQAEVLGYTLTGKDDVKTEIGDATVKEGKLNEEKYVVASIYGDLYTPKAVSRSKADKLMMKLANQYAGDNVFVLGAKYWNKPHKYNKKKIMVKEGLDLKKLETAIQDFQNKIKKQGSVTNARDEEHLKQLIKVYKEMGGRKIKEAKLTEAQYKTISLKTTQGYKEAEKLQKQGWVVKHVGLFTIDMVKEGVSEVKLNEFNKAHFLNLIKQEIESLKGQIAYAKDKVNYKDTPDWEKKEFKAVLKDKIKDLKDTEKHYKKVQSMKEGKLTEGVADEIRKQIPRRTLSYVGAKNFAKGKSPKGEFLEFSVKGSRLKTGGKIKVIYSKSGDDYTIEAWQIRGTNVKLVKKQERIQVDKLGRTIENLVG